MKLKTTLNGSSFAFRDIKDVLAKANEPKSADRFQGIAASTATERVAAKIVLSELTVGDLTENPTVPYEKDEVTRVNIDGLNKPMYERFKNMTIGELREWVLDHRTTTEELCRASRAFTGEVVAAVAKIMSAMDLVYGASKIVRPTKCITQIGLPRPLAYRCPTNRPTDDLPAITYWLMGSLTGAKMSDIMLAAVPMAVGVIVLFALRWRINILTMGDDEAATMGVNAKRLRILIIVAATLATAASVAVSGMIGWVGLVIPHLCRMMVGSDYRKLIPTSMLLGASFLLIVDNIARLASTSEIPIGILTAFVGAPFFLYLITRKKKV